MKRPLLLPFVPLYAAANQLRELRLRLGWESVQRLKWPVISVGNLSTGGTGKTPFTIALAELLSSQGFSVDVLSRGYGRQSSTVERVDPNGSPDRFGDEPILIAREARVPVYVGRQRFEAGLLAEQSDPVGSIRANRVHLLDDGFQHRQLARQIDIVLVNAKDLRETLLPAGNLREGRQAIKRADVLVIPSQDDDAIGLLQSMHFGAAANQPIWNFERKMAVPSLPPGTKIAAFCGIARPERFFTGLADASLRLVAQHAFSDHHRFTSADLESLLRLVSNSGARALVTTAKDLVRLGPMAQQLAQTVPLHEVALKTRLLDPDTIGRWIADRLEKNS